MDGTIQQISLFINFAAPILVLLITYLIGSYLERRHFRGIRKREAEAKGFPVITFEATPAEWRINRAELVSGSIVISVDYFKRVIAGLRGLIGGRVKTYEPLLERARREAVLRLIDDARSQGYDAVINVRLETSRLASSRRDGQGIAGVEMLAFGTAVKFASRFANSA